MISQLSQTLHLVSKISVSITRLMQDNFGKRYLSMKTSVFITKVPNADPASTLGLRPMVQLPILVLKTLDSLFSSGGGLLAIVPFGNFSPLTVSRYNK